MRSIPAQYENHRAEWRRQELEERAGCTCRWNPITCPIHEDVPDNDGEEDEE
jgi:hypothetical protein